MSKERTARRYTAAAIEQANRMSRDEYKAVKHMDKVQLAAYVSNVWNKGYEAGLAAAKEQAAEGDTPADQE